MSNPDTKNSVNFDGITTAIPVAIFFLLITTAFFLFRDSLPSFTMILWIGMILLAFIISSVVNIITQYVSCKQVNAGKAFLGSVPSVIGTIVALGIASISWCRIPVASFFSPLFIKKVVDVTKNKATTNINSLKNSNSKECCIPKVTLDMVENKYPLVAGLSYGFYVMFGVIFGTVIGTGISSLC
jgi:hypothetical protein